MEKRKEWITSEIERSDLIFPIEDKSYYYTWSMDDSANRVGDLLVKDIVKRNQKLRKTKSQNVINSNLEKIKKYDEILSSDFEPIKLILEVREKRASLGTMFNSIEKFYDSLITHIEEYNKEPFKSVYMQKLKCFLDWNSFPSFTSLRKIVLENLKTKCEIGSNFSFNLPSYDVRFRYDSRIEFYDNKDVPLEYVLRNEIEFCKYRIDYIKKNWIQTNSEYWISYYEWRIEFAKKVLSSDNEYLNLLLKTKIHKWKEPIKSLKHFVSAIEKYNNFVDLQNYLDIKISKSYLNNFESVFKEYLNLKIKNNEIPAFSKLIREVAQTIHTEAIRVVVDKIVEDCKEKMSTMNPHYYRIKEKIDWGEKIPLNMSLGKLLNEQIAKDNELSKSVSWCSVLLSKFEWNG